MELQSIGTDEDELDSANRSVDRSEQIGNLWIQTELSWENVPAVAQNGAFRIFDRRFRGVGDLLYCSTGSTAVSPVLLPEE